MRLGHLYVLAVNFQMSSLSPAAHLLRSLFVSPGIEASLLLLSHRAALLTNAPVALARTAQELALVSHQAKLHLPPKGQLILPLLVLAASLGANGLN